MRYLLDTGILLRLPHRNDPQHSVIRAALRNLTSSDHRFVTTRQNMAEFWNVCTRPADARGGFGLPINDVIRRMRLLERFIEVLSEPQSAYARWKQLVVQYSIKGKQVHDARIVALMTAHRITQLLTLNFEDFRRFREIQPVSPAAIAVQR
ncbi:MAG TPA: type II toxin-antitoxin system VapC family toxin [Tepidisphaeraceae bacterium]|nr:type II toxin-antitoxin system VapC family toxin [Tepidisphaeraceae bacterium]